jgi:PST family polysaccharide transporter
MSWTFLGAISQALLQFAALALLSRLLTVTEFGTASAASVVTSLAVMLSQLGIGAAVVQARELDRDDVRSAFVLATVLGVVLAGVLIAVAPLVGPVVGLPDGSPFLQMLSVVLVFGSVSIVAQGLLQRRMRFRALALVSILSYGIGYLGTATTLAAAGFGAVSLIWGQIVQAGVQAVAYHALARHDVRPQRLSVMLRNGRRLFGFGAAFSLSQMGNWVATSGDNLVVTTALGPTALGAYNRAYQLLVQPATLIGSVADKVLFPAMSRIQDDHPRLARAYVTGNSLVAMVTLPGSALLCVLAPEVVALVLGPGWDAVTLPLQIFALVLLPRTAYKISGSLTRATGAVLGGAARQWIYAAEVLVGCLIGSRWGVEGVAVGASIAIVLHTLTMLRFSARLERGLVLRVLRAYAKSLPMALAVAAACWPLADRLRESLPPVLVLLITAAAGLAAAAVTLALTHRFFRAEFTVLRRGRR